MADIRTTAAFIDTNILYDYVNLDQIKWSKELKADHVLIVITPVVIRELNDHKDSGRKPHLSERAASTIRNLNRFMSDVPDGNIFPIRAGVDLHCTDELIFAAYLAG